MNAHVAAGLIGTKIDFDKCMTFVQANAYRDEPNLRKVALGEENDCCCCVSNDFPLDPRINFFREHLFVPSCTQTNAEELLFKSGFF